MESRLVAFAVAVFLVVPTWAAAACFADYKAKRDSGSLQLHYGVIELFDSCSAADAGTEIQSRIAQDGWELLTVVSVFDDAGLDQRAESAGQFFLRY